MGKKILQPIEGVMVSAFSGAMNSLLTKLATLLEKDYKLLKDVRKDITSLRGEMSSMNALLVKLSEEEELDVQDKEWRDKVRELAYDMEDCVDIFMNDLDQGGGKAWLMNRFKKLKTRYKIANRIKDLKARAVEVKECHDRYKFDERIVRPRAVAVDPRVLALHAEATSLVGIDGPKEELIKLLTKEEGIQRLQVISIVGFGGIGKTTLANQVYTTIKRKYDCTALVSVSRNPDMVKILSGILSGVGCKFSSQADVGQLIGDLKEHLKDKRYIRSHEKFSYY